jgi:hypothetical protein
LNPDIFKAIKWGDWHGDTGARFCDFSGVAKVNSEAFPYNVANELICGQLAQLCGFPVPPGTVVLDDEGRLAYLGLRFAVKNESAAPIIPRRFVAKDRALCGKMIALDCWIANMDRHRNNVRVLSNDPFTAVFYDHGNALFGWQAGQGVVRLQDCVSQHCIGGDFARELDRIGGIVLGVEAISKLPESAIRGVCDLAVSVKAIDRREGDEAFSFLRKRQEELDKLLRDGHSAGAFPLIDTWRML